MIMGTMFEGMFGKVENGLCALSPNGIAIKTKAGYRSYDVKTGKLVNSDGMHFNFGDGMFFVIPASKVKPGDIILLNDKPVCVRKAAKDSIEVINYETSVVETVLPERHVFMGNTWFYGKIVSLFGNGSSIGKKNSMNSMMKFMMIQSLMGNTGTYEGGAGGLFKKMGAEGNGKGGMDALLPLMLMGNGNILDGMFDNIFDENDAEDADTEDAE